MLAAARSGEIEACATSPDVTHVRCCRFRIQNFPFFRRPMTEPHNRSSLTERASAARGELSLGCTHEADRSPTPAGLGNPRWPSISVATFSLIGGFWRQSPTTRSSCAQWGLRLAAQRGPGALHRQGWRPCRCRRRSERRKSPLHSCGRGKTLERYAGAAWHGLCFALSLARARSLRSARTVAHRVVEVGDCAPRRSAVAGGDLLFRAWSRPFSGKNGRVKGENRTVLSNKNRAQIRTNEEPARRDG